ncbi:zinc-binding dehydrogenase, partial [Streptomyces sp. 2MCAF27]
VQLVQRGGVALAPFAQGQQHRLQAHTVRADLAELFGLAADGGLTVVRGGRYPFAQAAAAHAALESRRTTGKVVLVP